jgi:23S rRNA pseudouridine1911/1915/1917 synthase
MTRPPAEHRVLVPAAFEGRRLDQALTLLLPDQSRSRLQQLIRDGHVQVDSRPATRSSSPVRGGAVVTVHVPPPADATPRPEALPLSVVFEDDDLLVVNKPAGMVVHPGAGHAAGTLVNALLHHARGLSGIGGAARPGIVHRLDRGTSGLMVVAKHDRAHQDLARQFAERRVTKEYAALVWGALPQGRRIELPVGRDPKDRKRMSTRARRARPASTAVVRAERLGGLTYVHLTIATGRTHQIRVHLSAVGHPVAGDALYGGLRRRLAPHLRALATLERPFLHARRLLLHHPADGRPLEFEAALPDDLRLVLDRLRADAEAPRGPDGSGRVER